MGRPREFDRGEILEKAMNVFWRHGYSATSIQDLLDEMGINRFTLYAEFGGKQSLFAAVLDHYRESCVSELFGPVEEDDASLPEIRTHLETLAGSTSGGPGNGCLMTNTILELRDGETPFGDAVRSHIDRLRCGFRCALENAARSGELGSSESIDVKAEVLVSAALGISVLARAGTGLNSASEYVERVLVSIR